MVFLVISKIEENRSRKLQIRNAVDILKLNMPCKDCGQIYEPFCMDFDHLFNKCMSVSSMIQCRFGLPKILKEIEKCELVCVLCHKKRTYDRSCAKNKSMSNHALHNRKYIQKYKDIIEAYKNKTCNICGNAYPNYQMEFDHLCNKIMPISVMANKRVPIDMFLEELNKCQVLCSLCHRRKTIKEFECMWNNIRIGNINEL